MAFDDAAFSELDVDPRALNRVSIGDSDRGIVLRELPDLLAALLRLVQAVRANLNIVVGERHLGSYKSWCREIINMLSEFVKPNLLLLQCKHSWI